MANITEYFNQNSKRTVCLCCREANMRPTLNKDALSGMIPLMRTSGSSGNGIASNDAKLNRQTSSSLSTA